MEIKLDWTAFKNRVDSQGLFLQYIDVNGSYILWAPDDVIVFSCSVIKNTPDATDFENNYMALANKDLVQRDPDGKPYSRAESRPLNCTTCFTGCGDSDSNIGDGVELAWDASDDTQFQTIVDSSFKRQRVVFSFLDSVWIKEGTIYYHNVLQGSYMDMFIVCPAGGYYYANDGTPRYAAVDTAVAHYVIHHPIQGTVAMGDELNTETCSSELPNSYKFWLEITVPQEDNSSNGHFEIEMYRTRTVILP